MAHEAAGRDQGGPDGPESGQEELKGRLLQLWAHGMDDLEALLDQPEMPLAEVRERLDRMRSLRALSGSLVRKWKSRN